MSKWFVILFCFSLTACGWIEEEPITLVSQIDGQEYLADVEGEMNAKKAARYILDGKTDSVSYEYKLDISDSLNTDDSVWRDRYFKALNLVLPSLDSIDVVYVAQNAFAFFLHYPHEFLNHLNNTAFDNSENWMNVVSYEYKVKTEPSDITINSVINGAHRHCSECDDDMMQLIVQYVNLLDTYQEPLLFNENAVLEALM